MTRLIRQRPRSALLIAGLLSCATTATAQLRPDDSAAIPADVVSALLTASSVTMGPPQLFVGAVPRSFEGVVVVPRNARLLGSAVFANSIVAAFTVPGAEDNVRQELARAIATAGWKAPVTNNAYQVFRYAPSATSRFDELAMCRDGDVLVVRVKRRDVSSSSVTESASIGQPSYPCQPAQQVAGAQGLPIPLMLVHPPGSGESVANMNECGPAARGQDSPSFPRNDYIRSSQPLEALLAHYGRQLQDSGWTAVKPGPSVARASWSRRDASGALYEAVLTVETGLRPGCVQVGLQMSKARLP